MNPRPIARFLHDFATGAAPAPANRVGVPLRQPDDAELKRHLEEAYRRGRADAQADADDALSAALADAKAKGQAELERARARWATEEGAAIAAAFSNGLRQLHEELSFAAAEALAPVLNEVVVADAVGALRAALHPLLAESSAVRLTVSGPDDLAAAILDGVQDAGVVIEHKPGSGPDVEIAIGTSVLETQFGIWSAAIRQAVMHQAANVQAAP